MGHRVLAVDLLGFGGSARSRDPEQLWADSQAAAIAELLENLAPEGAGVVGHDFGGPVALALIAQRADLVSHLALCASNAWSDTPIPLPIAAVTWPGIGHLAEHLLFARPSLRLMLKQGTGHGEQLDADRYLGDGEQQHAIRIIFATALREIRKRYAPMEATLRQVDVPTLVAWGDADPFFAVEQGEKTAAAIPGARFALYRGCGHFIPEERPSELGADLERLLANQ